MLALTLDGHTEYLEVANADDAMRRYWEAKQRGDPTAKLIRLPTTDPSPDDDPDDPPPAPAGAVSPTATARIREQEAWLDEGGFAVRPPLFSPGTRVVELGDDNFVLERQRVESLPPFPVAAQRVRDQIRREARDDIHVDLPTLEMDDTGALIARGRRYGLEPSAFQQFAMLGGFGSATRYLQEQCPPWLRAINVTTQVRRHNDRKVVLRTRDSGMGHRQTFAVVSPSYAAVDSDLVLASVTASLSDAHVEMRYDGTGVRATALWMPDHVVDLAAGDIFKVGVRVETDDTGRGRIRIAGVVFRNLCLNLIIIDESEVETVNAVHRGDPQRIVDQLGAGAAKARQSVHRFLEAWGHARTVKIDPADTIRGWLDDKRITLPGVRTEQQREDATQVFLAALAREPGDTLADAVNAVTRAAHEQPGWPMDLRESLERQASRLVLVPA